MSHKVSSLSTAKGNQAGLGFVPAEAIGARGGAMGGGGRES